jgi:dihydrolipoamide dehydrogenase
MAAKFDVVVIGSGPGGYVAAVRAAQLGFKTAIIEKNPTLGGTCLNIGCIPSKALLQSTELYIKILESKIHGISTGSVTFDWNQIQQRKDKVVDSLVTSVAVLMKKYSIERFEGTGEFFSPTSIQVTKDGNKQEIETTYAIIATGSIPVALPFLPFDEKHVVSSTGALSLSEVPKKLLVIGAGIIGVEIGSVYRRLGSAVTVVEMLDRICPTVDAGIARTLQRILTKQGMEFKLSAKLSGAVIDGGKVKATVQMGDKTDVLDADVILVAIGRKPYTAGLGLEKIGLNPNQQGQIEVNGDFQTQIPHIYAIGDVVDGPMLAHKASEEGVAAAEVIAGLRPHMNYLAIPNIVYTHPEVAAVGMTEEEAKAAGLQLSIGQCLFKGNARARCNADDEGLVKIIAEKTSQRLLGMHILGAGASEMIGEGVVALEKKLTVEALGTMSHGHPTMCEAIKEACLQAVGKAIHI